MADKNKKMYVGIDMGTNSVGMAVTDEHYDLYRVKGKDYWCSRTFSSADTAVERRMNRISRRCRQREVARLGTLRELFSEEIQKVDEGFFARLDESRYYLEDKENKQPYALFADTGYTDKEYYKDYPTIFHLRKELIESDQPHDVRLVYLAIANMYKHRGHFLNDSLSSDQTLSNIEDAYQNLVDEAAMFGIYFPESVNVKVLESKIGEKGIAKKQILANVCEFLEISKRESKQAYELLCLICGMTGKLINIYGEEAIGEDNKSFSISFRDSNYEDKEAQTKEILGEEYFALLQAAKELHDIGLLSAIMKGCKYLSEARVAQYEEHRHDLKLLQSVLRKYDKSEYDKMFRTMEDGNYSAYVGSVNSSTEKVRRNGGKGRTRDDFYKNVKKVLAKFPQEDVDIRYIQEKIENETFMPKQLTFANGVIPNQLHASEMKAILNQAEKYLPFLSAKDESGLTVSQKILQLFTFKIPYYVGPIGQNHIGDKNSNVWAKRRPGEEQGKVYPWNFEQKIDTKAAAEAFIERMVRPCTYLKGQNTLPKCSLLYEKFMVLNELNNLRINGEKPSVSVKQLIYQELFEKGKRVTLNQLKEFLYHHSIVASKEETVITGISDGFNSSLTSVGKFRGIFGDQVLTDHNRKMIEKIIFWGTIYGNDKKFFRERMEENYGDELSREEIKRIAGFKFNGWGNLSKEFLELEGSCECGECSLIQAMWNTNHNLMELLSDQYTFFDSLKKRTKEAYRPLAEWTIEDLDGNYLSAPVKRMVWQTIKMLREVQETTGKEPDKIFIEMTREHGEKGKQTVSRKKKLLSLYQSIQKEQQAWVKSKIIEIDGKPEADFKIKKLYLYYLQLGRCMYSGSEISLDDLMNDNLYDIDHIYPRHFRKDDSIENNLVLVKKEINNHKQDTFPLEHELQSARMPYWKSLVERGFITKEKYNRLTRKDAFTPEEKAEFINRQLVETGQGTKTITQILQQAFPNTKIVFVKAAVVSDFRKKFSLLKVRALNDTHHAKDAYLNIVAGNTYDTKFTNHPLNFIKEAEKRGTSYHYHMDKIFDYNVERNGERAWIADHSESISKVKKTVGRNTVLITKKTEEVHGALSNKATIWGKNVAKKDVYLPVKSTDVRASDVTKYGGITAIANSGYTLVEYQVNDKIIRSLEALPVSLGRAEQLTEDAVLQYIIPVLQREHKKKKVEHVRVCQLFIPQKSKVKIDGFDYYLGGKSGNSIYLTNAVPLYLAPTDEEYLRKLLKGLEKNDYQEIDKDHNLILTPEKNMALYRALMQKLQGNPFVHNKWNIYRTLEGKEAVFAGLNMENQCYVVNQILMWITSSTQSVDLQLMRGSKHSGIMLMNKKISVAKEFVLIHQSVTGIYETKTDLLLV